MGSHQPEGETAGACPVSGAVLGGASLTDPTEIKQILERDGGGFFRDAIKDDPPAHTRVRRLMEKAFTAHRVAQLEPGITAVIVDLIDKLAAKAEKDGV